MELRVLGSCSGTEPMPQRHHTSVALTAGENLYLFDAGESASHTGHLLGLDFLRLRAVFISHPHIDHTGGLPNVMWLLLKKLQRRKYVMNLSTLPKYPLDEVTLCLPDERLWEGTQAFLRAVAPESLMGLIPFRESRIRDGMIVDDGIVSVEALHNAHLGVPADGDWRSFSFRILCEGRRIVYSGDVQSIRELDPFLREGCDCLLMETGHHHPWEVAQYLSRQGFEIEQLVFMHHGRDFLDKWEESTQRTKAVYPNPFLVAEDGMKVIL